MSLTETIDMGLVKLRSINIAENSHHCEKCGNLVYCPKKLKHISTSDFSYHLNKLLDALKASYHNEFESLQRQALQQIENIRNEQRYSHLIFKSIKTNDLQALKSNTGLDCNIMDNFGNTLLHYAAQYGDSEMLQYLLQEGADINSRNNNMDIPLHIAAQYSNNIEFAQQLFDGNDQFDYKNKMNYTPLHLACKYSNEKIVKLLLEKNADSNIKTNNNLTAIMCCENQDILLIYMNNTTLIKSEKEYLLFKSIKKNWINAVKKLIDSNMDIDCKDQECNTPILTAAKYGVDNILKLLIDSKNVHIKNAEGNSALHVAASTGSCHCIDILLQNGAYINEIGFEKRTALMYAALHGHINVITYLVDNGADINRVDCHSSTALHFAAIHGQIRAAESLVNRGAYVDVRNEYGQTPLYFAAFFGHVKLIQFLLIEKADVNSISNDFITALHVASNNNFPIAVDILLKNGASIDRRDKNQFSPINVAQQKNHVDVLNVFYAYTNNNNKSSSKLNNLNMKNAYELPHL